PLGWGRPSRHLQHQPHGNAGERRTNHYVGASPSLRLRASAIAQLPPGARLLERDFEAFGTVTLETRRDRLEECDDFGRPRLFHFAKRLEIARDLRELGSSLIGEAERGCELAEEVLLFRVDLVVDTAQPRSSYVREGLIACGQPVEEELIDSDGFL